MHRCDKKSFEDDERMKTLARCRKFSVINHVKLIFFCDIPSRGEVVNKVYHSIVKKFTLVKSEAHVVFLEYLAYKFEINQDKVKVGGPCQILYMSPLTPETFLILIR